MRNALRRLITKHGSQICAVAILAGNVSVKYCRVLFYQPKEPENLGRLLKK